MRHDTLKKISPNALEYEIDSGSKLHYFRHWQPLTLVLSNISIGYRTNVFERNTNIFRKNDEVIEKMRIDGVDALTVEELEKIESLFDDDIDEVKKSFRRTITATAKINNDRITAIDLGNDSSDQWQAEYRDLLVDISEQDENHLGSIWHEREGHYFVESGLHCSIYLTTAAMNSTIESLKMGNCIVAHGDALLYQDEVEASLNEPEFPNHYVLQADGRAKFALNSITAYSGDGPRFLDTDFTAFQKSEDNETISHIGTEEQVKNNQANRKLVIPKNITIAIWLIVFISFLHVLAAL